MKPTIRYLLIFIGALLAGCYLHELGHAIAGWLQGVAVFPTTAKEYILRPQLDWSKETWIALGGVLGTTIVMLASGLWFWRKPSLDREAVLAGALVPSLVYTLRFLLMGRGHDGTEWQAAQTALGLRPAGHAIDVFMACLLVVTVIIWGVRLRPRLWFLLRFLALAVVGTFLLVGLQAGNNAVFDRVLQDGTVVNVPAGLDPR